MLKKIEINKILFLSIFNFIHLGPTLNSCIFCEQSHMLTFNTNQWCSKVRGALEHIIGPLFWIGQLPGGMKYPTGIGGWGIMIM